MMLNLHNITIICDGNPICTRADLGSIGLEPCRKLEKLVKNYIRKSLKFLCGEYCGNVIISSLRTPNDVKFHVPNYNLRLGITSFG